MGARHLFRLVQAVFDSAYNNMQQEKGEDSARKLKQASTHWLRHTGASMEVERGRALKDIAEDLGHASNNRYDLCPKRNQEACWVKTVELNKAENTV